MKKGKIITITSSKGGVGKTIFLLNLAGILSLQNKKVLIMDCSFTSGSIGLNLNLNPVKNIFHISDDLAGNHFKDYKSYITKYNENIDVVTSCKDPRQALKIDINYIIAYINEAKNYYDAILIDTTHGLTKDNLLLLDTSDTILYMMTNDLMDIKNTKSFLDITHSVKMNNIKVILNNSRDINLNYFSKYEIRSMINNNIDYLVDKTLYIKNITSFILEGEIFTLNKSLTFKDKKDLKKLENMAIELMEDEI